MKYITFLLVFLCCIQLSHAQQTVADTAFSQEYHEAYPVGKTAQENEVRSIAVDKHQTVWIATALGILKKTQATENWVAVLDSADNGPAYCVAADAQGNVWMGTWKGMYVFKNNKFYEVPGTTGPVAAICTAKEGSYALGPGGVWLYHKDSLEKKNYVLPKAIRHVISDNAGGIWVATDVGLYHCNAKGCTCTNDAKRLCSAALKGLALDAQQQLWVAGLGGVSIFQHNKQSKFLQPATGLPSIYVNCVQRSPEQTMWIGTHVGLVRYKPDGSHSLLFSRRWLLDDQVNDIAFDTSGNAWIATNGGVSAIKKKRMTLQAKQDFFYNIQMKRHMRQPWISGQCHLITPGDTSSWQPEDDDNDGEYTANYLAMESFRYAASKNPDAKEKARKAFDFLTLLETITEGDGYFARTIVPINWGNKVHDGNRSYTPQELAEELVKDPRFKPVETRWHLSKDGQWLWKGDASSDEWCGHMMGYYFYYELAADTTAKQLVRQHVKRLVDHLIAHNFNMMDVDGTHTHWSVWSPQSLNHDPDWQPDRAENSMELLAFLKLAYHVTDDTKYQQQYLKLIHQDHYLDNMASLLQQNPAWFIYFDVVLQAYLFPILLKCETDPQLLSFYQRLMDQWMNKRRNDKNPLLNFLYCYSRDTTTALATSLDFLKDTPLDLVSWHIDHTKREDIRIVHQPVLDDWQVSELPPASIRATVRWDSNPWEAVNGSPDIEREPVFWLLPYWMGRYLKLIE